MAVTIKREGRRVYFVGDTYPIKDRLKRELGLDRDNWDSERRQWWVGIAKLSQAEALVASLSSPATESAGKGLPTTSESDDRRVRAKVNYRGSTWYVIAESHEKGRCQICKLSGLARWVDMADCEIIKTYAPREYRGRTKYTTLGSIRGFIEEQKRLEASDVPQCAACGKRSESLVHDLEDGLMKCRACCDMPAD